MVVQSLTRPYRAHPPHGRARFAGLLPTHPHSRADAWPDATRPRAGSGPRLPPAARLVLVYGITQSCSSQLCCRCLLDTSGRADSPHRSGLPDGVDRRGCLLSGTDPNRSPAPGQGDRGKDSPSGACGPSTLLTPPYNTAFLLSTLRTPWCRRWPAIVCTAGWESPEPSSVPRSSELDSNTKQHYILDVVAGIFLACVAYSVFLRNDPREASPRARPPPRTGPRSEYYRNPRPRGRLLLGGVQISFPHRAARAVERRAPLCRQARPPYRKARGTVTVLILPNVPGTTDAVLTVDLT